MRARAVVATLVSAAVAACSLIVDTSDLAGGAASSDAGRADGSSGASSGAGGDAGSPGDATVDAAADGPLGRFCPAGGGHALCADFDDGNLNAGWSDTNVGPTGSLILATERARSAPGSFHARLGRRESALDYATLVFRGAGGWRRTTLDADVFVASPAWKQGDINAGIFTINFYSDAKSEGSALSIGPDYATFGNPGAAKNGAAISFDQWFHLHVVIDPAGSARLELGAQLLEQTFPALSPNAGAITTVELGISGYNKPCPQFDVWYDNVTIDFQ